MKKGINQWSFPTNLSIKECLAACKKYGYEGFEPAFDEEGPLSMESTDDQLRALKAASVEMGMPFTSLASGVYWANNPVSNHSEVRARAEALLRRQIEAASLIGVDTILFVPGTVGAGLDGVSSGVSYDQAYDRTLELLGRVEPHARALNITIGIENVWNNFLLSPLEMRALVDTIDSPHVAVYFDVGNVIRTGEAEQWIRILGKRIAAVHFKDFKRSIGTLDGFVDLLEGDVHYPAVVAALREVGYTGYVVAEMSNASGEWMAEKTALAMDRILAM